MGLVATLVPIALAVLLDDSMAGMLDARSSPSVYGLAHLVSRFGEGWVIAAGGGIAAYEATR